MSLNRIETLTLSERIQGIAEVTIVKTISGQNFCEVDRKKYLIILWDYSKSQNRFAN